MRSDNQLYFRPVSGRTLQQSVLKHVKHRPEGILEGAAVGFDAAAFPGKGEIILQASGAASTDWFPDGASVTAEEAAFRIAENQMTAGGAKPETLQVFLTMGRAFPEERLRGLMQRLSALSSGEKCPVVGGNTVYFGEGNACLIQLLMTGVPWSSQKPKTVSEEMSAYSGISFRDYDGKPGRPGDSVFFVGEVGCLGAELLTVHFQERLRKTFSESYLRNMRYPAEAFSIKARAEKAWQAGASFLHDVSYGGVYAALYQLAEAGGTGISVRHEGLKIRQSVIELCEALNISPYLLLGTGAFLAVVPAGREGTWTEEMNRAGIAVHAAGTLTKEKARVVRAEGFPMERYLNLPDGDAMSEVFTADNLCSEQ